MKKFTKKQRNKIYRRAMYEHLSNKKRIPTWYKQMGLCGILQIVIAKKYNVFLDYNEIFESLPEFAETKPKNKNLGEYWWKRDKRNMKRKIKLQQMIDATNEKFNQ